MQMCLNVALSLIILEFELTVLFFCDVSPLCRFLRYIAWISEAASGGPVALCGGSEALCTVAGWKLCLEGWRLCDGGRLEALSGGPETLCNGPVALCGSV